jgi:hypothetical protein
MKTAGRARAASTKRRASSVEVLGGMGGPIAAIFQVYRPRVTNAGFEVHRDTDVDNALACVWKCRMLCSLKQKYLALSRAIAGQSGGVD